MARALSTLVSEYDCPCGQKHIAVGRLGNMSVIVCEQARPGLHYYPTLPFLVSGPEPDKIAAPVKK